ncbi:DUF4421 family protein [Tamlana sp. s12]|uniref:DUF4421 family protein n=1 Tax=Tamlana sp. s12 TaxID=1630406 RepID=UPI00192C7908|nr:DUF4421 family protein [Tamlana sp. s12]QQY83126.1 DUF4421 family protein [Tamlana sp. s12]
MKLKPIYLLLSLLSTSLYAQNEPQNAVNDSLQEIIYGVQNNDYIYVYKNRVTARLFYVNTSNSLRIKDTDSDLSADLTPNKQNRIGASIAFRSINMSYSFAPNFLAENKDNEDSRLLNFNIRTYFGKHFMQTLDIYSQKGFYLSNKNNDFNFYSNRTKSLKIGGSTSYIMNENFSFRAIASQDEKQLKSVGSFIPRIVYYYTDYDVDFEDTLGSPPDGSKSFDVALAPSYFYNFVPTKNLFLSAGVSAGIGINYSKEDNGKKSTALLTELDFRGTLTYDVDNIYLGADYSYLVLNHNSDSSTYLNDNIPFIQFFVGYRFKASRKMVNKADSVNKKLHFN